MQREQGRRTILSELELPAPPHPCHQLNLLHSFFSLCWVSCERTPSLSLNFRRGKDFTVAFWTRSMWYWHSSSLCTFFLGVWTYSQSQHLISDPKWRGTDLQMMKTAINWDPGGAPGRVCASITRLRSLRWRFRKQRGKVSMMRNRDELSGRVGRMRRTARGLATLKRCASYSCKC